MLLLPFAVRFLLPVLFLLTAISPAVAATQTGTFSGAAGEYKYYDIILPSPQSGVRLVLSSDLATDFYLYTGTNHLAGSQVASSTNKTLHTLLVAPTSLTDGGSYHVRVRAASGLATPVFSFSYTDDLTFTRDLTWDPGTALAGTAVMNQPDTAGGDYLFRITSQASANGAWRNALRVTGGEADLYMQQSTPPVSGGTYSSTRTGSDGFVLSGAQFADNQTWYLRVHALPGATWQLYSGDIYVHDLGGVAADGSSSSPTVTIGPEGTYFFSTTVDAATQAWRLWLNGSTLPIYVKKLSAPVATSQNYHEQYEQGQMLLVPPYLTNASYFVGVTGAPGDSFALDSRKQQILVPSALPGYSQGGGTVDFDFNLTGEGNGGGFGYRTYRIDVPVDQIAWQVNVTPVSGNPELYVRKAEVPNRWMNNGLSEAPSGVGDSITQVPPTLTNGVWYVTVYGTGTFSYTLTSGNPTVTGSYFINTSDPNPVPPGYAYPYNTFPITNNETSRSGWRYYQVSNIDSQLGFLGWQLDLANQVAGSEIAIRRNAVPSRWLYRTGGDAYHTSVSQANQADVSSTVGFLQHPGHPADIWYIGVNAPNQALGAFELTTREIPAPLNSFTGSTADVSNQPATTWQWFKYTVPADALGWDFRMKVTGGTPRMVVRRDQLPAGFGTSSYQNVTNSWPSGNQWEGGDDWTGRTYITYSSVRDKNKYLIMGMGSPLEPGTYYVGVSGTDVMSYTLESRGIGIGSDSVGTPWPIQVGDLGAFNGGSVSDSGLAPREAAYYRITVPAGTVSWSVKLNPTLGESLLLVRQGRLPNVAASGYDSDNASYFSGAKRQKDGAEYFYKYQPSSGATTITPGVYYLAVVSEGQNPTNSSTIGTGGVDYTLTSEGVLPVNDKTATPVTAINPVSWSGETQAYGAQKIYRFRIPAGLTSIEVRLKNRVGNPNMALRQDAAGSGLIPYPASPTYRADEGGRTYSAYNDTLITLTQPVEGDYTVVVSNQYVYSGGYTYPDAGYDLEITAQGVVDLAFTNSSLGVSNQEANTWRYFKMIVPNDATLLGWDFRMKVTGGTPRMVVRRDQLPAGFGTSSYQNVTNSWPSGNQWEGGDDWTGRTYITYSSVRDKNKYLIMGMGSPLEPGTYYVGVSGTDVMSYTLESRGIGIGSDSVGTPWPIQVGDLGAFNGGSVSDSGLAPREAAYYRITVPAGTVSWSVKLNPTLGESLLLVRQGRLPNVAASGYDSDNASYFSGAKRQKDGAEYFYKYQPSSGATTITPGVYYLAVVSEGQNPTNSSTIGTGGVDYTLTSEGVLPVNDKTATPVTAINPVSWSGETQAYGAQKIYRFRIPAGLTSIEVRLKNRVGNPNMALRQDAAGSGLIPYPASPTYRADEGGRTYSAYNDTLITLTQPVEGDYTVVVSNQYVYSGGYTYPDAGYDLEVRALTPAALPITGGAAATGSLIDQQVAYYQVEVPEELNGQPVLGWLLKSAVSNGAVSIRVRKDLVPGNNNTGAVVSANSAITIVPPVLTPGTWYVEVKATGITDYSLSSDIVSADPAKHRRTWTMPSRIGTFTQAGLTAPWFGDSGVDDSGAPIINPDTLDQGTDLAKGEWHFYRVTVPVDNSALLRTVLEALSGMPQLYLRTGNVPSIDHYANPTNPTQGPTLSYDRSQTLTGTLYGNWVPLDGKTETKLASGDWWIGVRAVTTNIRYRLKLAAGDVHDAGGGRLDTAGYVQDLAQSGGSVSSQNLAAGDMRYYRVTVPQSSVTLAESTPLAWNLTLAQQGGDVVVFVRDTIPPGQGTNGNAGSAVGNSDAASSYFQDWYDDNTVQSPNPYIVVDAPGIPTTLALPPVEPGKTYYLGVYARTDATFDLSSTVGAGNLPLTAILPFAGGTDTRTLAAGEQALYRIDVPVDAILWHHSATNAAGIQFYLGQGTVPPQNSYAHWRSNSAVNTTLNQVLNGFPWQPGHSCYLLVRNTTAGALQFTFTMDGRTELVPLNITVAGNGSGSVGSSPNLISCAGGTCSAQIFPYTPITLTRNWSTGTTFTGWSGDCSGTGNCILTMNVPHTVTATFTLNSYTVTTNRSGNGSITSSPAGIDCRTAGGTCSAPYLYGTSITLTATPDAGNVFTGWSGACTGTGACTLTVEANKSVTATFVPLRTLTVAFSGSGSGTVTSTSDTGISCTTGSSIGCTHDYPNGTVVSLSAVADWKSVFGSWTGVTSSSGTDSSVTMSVAKAVTATFGSAANARISTQDYATLLGAYTAAPAGASILMKDIAFKEYCTFEPASAATIYTLKGGFADFAGSASGYSTIMGDLKVRNGRLNVQRLIVKP